MSTQGDKRYEVRWFAKGVKMGYPVWTPDIAHFCQVACRWEGSIIQWREDGSEDWHDVLPN